jgi:hypothetical protein
MRLIDRRKVLGGLAVTGFAGTCPDAAQAADSVSRLTPISVKAHPIAHFEVGRADTQVFGPLRFRGGLELSADHRAFGGLSGIAMRADGNGFLALTDVGTWLRAEITYAGDRPTGLANAVLAPVLAPGSGLAHDGRAFDTEALALDGSTAYVGVERVNQVWRFDLAREDLAARPRILPVPKGVQELGHNRGLESLAVAPSGSPHAGSLIGIGERGLSRTGPLPGWFLTGPQREASFRIVRTREFDATDATFHPNGDLLLLERSFSLLKGVKMRLRRFPAKALRPGAEMEGDVLIEADMGYQIDNMEALGLHRDRSGQVILTLLSDDNFSILQRTLLLQFALEEAP